MRAVLILSLMLIASAPFGFGGGNAYAENCLSIGDARAAAAKGEIVPIGRAQAQILSAAGGGQIVGIPKLCNIGGQLVYIVSVLTPQGVVKRVTVSASDGNIIGY